MDRKNAYVGEWSPLIQLDAKTPHGISQSGFSLRAGRAYTGRVVLAKGLGAKVEISLIWGPKPEDRQTITVHALTSGYAKIPLKFTAKADTSDGAFEIDATPAGVSIEPRQVRPVAVRVNAVISGGGQDLPNART